MIRFYFLLMMVSVSPLGAQPADGDFFEKKIRPVLATSCYGCHSSKMKSPMGGLALDTRRGLELGGASGLAIMPGQPAASLLLRALSYNDLRLKMPPTGRLPASVLADFEQWVKDGAADPRPDVPMASPPVSRGIDLEKGRQWWSFLPVRENAAPNTTNREWAKTKIDSFVLAKLEERGLQPSPPADDVTLAQRVYVDLIGLKPTFDEVQQFINDRTADRYEKLIDRLLSSHQYGERWARYWLDVARYAEDNAENITNAPYPYAWRYRDWVIEALNADVPYDRFVKLQLAADHLPGTPRSDYRALGYLGLSPIGHKDGRLAADVVETLHLDEMEERVDAVGRGLLGLTVACARCHDHKFDPIGISDYYALAGVFASTSRAPVPLFEIDPRTESRFIWLQQRLFDMNYITNVLHYQGGSKPEQNAEEVRKFRIEIAKLEQEAELLKQRYSQLGAHIANLRYPADPTARKRKLPPVDVSVPFVNGVYDASLWTDSSEPDITLIDYRPGVPKNMHLLRGGNLSSPGEVVPRRFLRVLSKGEPEPFRQGSGRAELAERIFADAAPLAARVIVNRIWRWHFDRALVATPSDFGAQGEKPSHPELLDDLAARFIAHGWSLKWLHREILLSQTYRQSSRPRADAEKVDPANRWLWRMNPRRLDIESYRDSILRAAETLDPTPYGPSQDGESSKRRTIYTRISRGRSADLLRLYDFPDPSQHSPGRTLTVTPLQQLFVMNSAWLREQAAAVVRSLETVPEGTARVRALYRRILAREPNSTELDRAMSYLARASWPQYAQVLLATDEVIFWP